MGKGKKKGRADQFAAGNAARRMDALADLVRDRQITAKDGAVRIAEAFDEFMAAVRSGAPTSAEDMGHVTYALGVGLNAALVALKKRGPVMLRYIDGDALITMLMPDGPPPGMGGK